MSLSHDIPVFVAERVRGPVACWWCKDPYQPARPAVRHGGLWQKELGAQQDEDQVDLI